MFKIKLSKRPNPLANTGCKTAQAYEELKRYEFLCEQLNGPKASFDIFGRDIIPGDDCLFLGKPVDWTLIEMDEEGEFQIADKLYERHNTK